MPQNLSADKKIEASKFHDPEAESKSPGLRRVMNFARENMGDEGRAEKNLEKDPSGPIRARANTQARMRAAQESPGDIYNFSSNIRTPDKSKVGPSIHDKSE